MTSLAIKIKTYLHISYLELFGCLRSHNITYITKLNIQKIKIESLQSTSQASDNVFLQPRERNLLAQNSVRKLQQSTLKLLFLF